MIIRLKRLSRSDEIIRNLSQQIYTNGSQMDFLFEIICGNLLTHSLETIAKT